MPRINEMAESKFIKKEDCDPPILVTVTQAVQHDVSMQNDPTEMKWCLEFAETTKPLVLNMTHMRQIEAITGSDNTDDWIGKKLVLFLDPNVTYGGKITGGTRVRAPKQQAQQQVPPDAQNYTQNPSNAMGGPAGPPYDDSQIPF